jgi:hypothetical protein
MYPVPGSASVQIPSCIAARSDRARFYPLVLIQDDQTWRQCSVQKLTYDSPLCHQVRNVGCVKSCHSLVSSSLLPDDLTSLHALPFHSSVIAI